MEVRPGLLKGFCSQNKFCLVISGVIMAVILSISSIVLVCFHLNAVAEPNGRSPNRFQSEDSRKWSNSRLSVTEYTGGRAKPGQMIFQDEFNTLDLETWQHEITAGGGGNWEFQIYHNNRSNSYVKYGKLYIKPTLTADKYGEAFLTSGELDLNGGSPADACTNPQWFGCKRQGTPTNLINPVMSARIRTINSFAFKYGIVKVKAKLPAGDWLWPAIWLLPKTNQYGNWPASGEIDILEGRGNLNLTDFQNVNVGAEQAASTLHFGPFFPMDKWDKAHFKKNSPAGEGFDKEFHEYGLEWTPEHMTFSIDDEVIGTVNPSDRGGFWELGEFGNGVDNPWRYSDNPKMAPFDQQFYLVINLAVGGTNWYFPDNLPNSNKPWKNSSPQAPLEFWNGRSKWLPTWRGEDAALQIDYVRVWAL